MEAIDLVKIERSSDNRNYTLTIDACEGKSWGLVNLDKHVVRTVIKLDTNYFSSEEDFKRFRESPVFAIDYLTRIKLSKGVMFDEFNAGREYADIVESKTLEEKKGLIKTLKGKLYTGKYTLVTYNLKRVNVLDELARRLEDGGISAEDLKPLLKLDSSNTWGRDDV